jgi:predicted unusual protein kinase regulating ubiquinone biosynthesis (AarF/ABC1/UbiB family)
MTRAMGILSGVTSKLDPEFDAWKETAPFAQRLIREDVTTAVRRSVEELVAGRLPSSLGSLLRMLPVQAPRQPGSVAVDVRSAEVTSLRRSVNRLTGAVVAVGVLAVGIALKARGAQISDLAALWPGNDLGLWIIELSGISLVVILLRRRP